jgi:phage shock protein A
MSDRGSSITITSGSARPLRPLVEAAIQREVDLLSAGIRRTEQHIRAFERQHGMSSAEFLRQHQNDELAETLDTIDWIGELRLLERLREKETTLKELRFAD